VAGWTGRNEWNGFIPFDALPFATDPEEGFFATANQPVTGPGYAYRLGEPQAFGYRSQRIVDILRKRGTLSVADMAQVQLDTRNGFAPELVPYLLDVDLGSAYYREAQRLLRGWDFTQPPGSAPAAYFNAVWRHLLARTFHDQMPEDTWPEGGDRWFEVVAGMLDRPNSEWWDDVDTPDVRESRDDIVEQAMKEARDELVRLQARSPEEWTWGHQHVLDLENQTVGQSDIGLVRRLLNRGGYELGGGTSIVDATGWTAFEGYHVDWVPSMRMVVSMRDLDESTWVNLTGASGHAFHPNYTDQTELWASGRTVAWPFTRAAVDEAARHTLTLEPAAG
jgi:penicillin amidase